MRPHFIMFLGWVFAIGTLISLTFAGLWLGDTEAEIASAVTVFKQANILGVWSVTVPNPSFFLLGARAFSQFDFGFFQGAAGIFQWVLMLTIGAAFLWGLFTVAVGVVQGLFRRP